eukprot:jgi/Tetstr1/425297/TSEL_015748.t1
MARNVCRSAALAACQLATGGSSRVSPAALNTATERVAAACAAAEAETAGPDHDEASRRLLHHVAALCAATTAAASGLLLPFSRQPVVACDAKPASSTESATEAAGPAPSPFVYPELEGGIQRRIASQQRLMEYMQEKRRDVQAAQAKFERMGGPGNPQARQWMAKQMARLQEEVNQETQFILYGVRERGARDRYMARFGCAAWTDEAMEAIARFSPLIEIGAGKGQWEAELSRRGVDVVAFDNGVALPTPELPPVGRVAEGDHTQLAHHPRRTLLLVYPEGDMAMQCLQEYRGEVLLYVGEGRGGVTASAPFFDALEAGWRAEAVIPLAPFRENYERLYVMRRCGPPPKKRWFGWV